MELVMQCVPKPTVPPFLRVPYMGGCFQGLTGAYFQLPSLVWRLVADYRSRIQDLGAEQ